MSKWHKILSTIVPIVAGPPQWQWQGQIAEDERFLNAIRKPKTLARCFPPVSWPSLKKPSGSYRASNPFHGYNPELAELYEQGRDAGRLLAKRSISKLAYMKGYEDGFTEAVLESVADIVGSDICKQVDVLKDAYRQIARQDVLSGMAMRFPRIDSYCSAWHATELELKSVR